MRLILLIALVLISPGTIPAQWQLQDAHTTADLRGIDSVGNGVAWASGTNGTVLRTEDSGFVWQLCAVPPGAEHLDFRGIQAFDNNTAIVMSSGKGDLSRLYKTTDGCQTWKLLFTNPDPEGFWDDLHMDDANNGYLLGDPVRGRFFYAVISSGNQLQSFVTKDGDLETNRTPPVERGGRGAFAASNSGMITPPTNSHHPRTTDAMHACEYPMLWFGTGGPGGAKVHRIVMEEPQCTDYGMEVWHTTDVPIDGSSGSAGIFSMAAADLYRVVAVGGDYTKPGQGQATAAFTLDGGRTWTASTTPPHGYRSAVAYDQPHNSWITVGPNGTDISTDDGRNWRSLTPNIAAGDPPDADQHWNALSLPFVVGPHGRIATLRPEVLPTHH